ncbi:hypothetical protein ACOSP7_021351 [Xanthoceras sorbifolium]
MIYIASQTVNFSNIRCDIIKLMGDNYKTKISAGIRGSMDQHDNVRDLLKVINDQFIISKKALANTIIIKFLSLRLTSVKGLREHIMHMRDIAA